MFNFSMQTMNFFCLKHHMILPRGILHKILSVLSHTDDTVCFFVDLLTLKHDWLAFLCSFEGFIWRIWQSGCYLKIKSFQSDKFESVSAWNTTRRMYCEVWGEVLTIVNSLPKNQYSPPVQIKHLFYSL